ncbi:MAG: NERD domain-containing protein/DEAD/DEAH box helicase [Proteobacteria bacterium]|nr:NERD domain-containing protein/DEAD/DEAH box helicase [Pseudomonadota bacterium]
MANLVPKIAIDEIASKPERDVARVLVDRLPNQVTVFHSYPWLRPDRNDRTGKVTLREGEADFLILWPELGFLVLEVKGGEIHYAADKRVWYRALPSGGERFIKDPFEQASKNMHALTSVIADRVYGGSRVNFAHGYAAIFPDCIFSGPTPPGAQAVNTWSADDLNKIDKRVSTALRQFSHSDPPRAIPSDELEKVKTSILPIFRLERSLGRMVEHQEEQLFRLTESQSELLEFLGDNERVLIEGVAGSGKTILAKRQAQRFADRGLKTLMLCYNKNLSSSIGESLADDNRQLIDVFHFHSLCSELCRQAGVEFSPPADPEAQAKFWRNDAAALLWDAIDQLPDLRYDAIIVDEGQDFNGDWWEPIELLNIGGGEGFFYIFYDPVQNLYNSAGAAIPALGKPFQLRKNCRNTLSIIETCSHIIRRDIEPKDGTPKGLETEFVQVARGKETRDQLKHWLQVWLGRGGLKASQIVILSPYSKMNSSLAGVDQIGGSDLTYDLNTWRQGQGVLVSTMRAFKGLEADVVVLIDLPKPGSVAACSVADFYVGSSRAKHVLRVISTEPKDVLLGGITDE